MLQLSCRWRRIRCGPAEYFTHPGIPLKFRYLLPTFLLLVNSYCTAGSAHVPKRLNQRQLEQLVRCMQRTELNRKQFGPVLRFRYKVVATRDQDADFDVNVVAYHRGSEKTGLLVIYGVIRRRCMVLDVATYAVIFNSHGRPVLSMEHMANGGLGTLRGLTHEMHETMRMPLIEVDTRKLPRTCEKCISLEDEYSGADNLQKERQKLNKR